MASTSSQPPSSSTTTTKWDVFLSFRGIDTRYTFTSHLYSMLCHYNIRTFKDDPELQSGEVISDALLEAIQESKTYIVVLSENYASSSWCLEELVEIISCSNTKHRLVIPVFYNIDPSVVRRQSDSFQKAFAKHEVRFAGEIERVEKWRLTLSQIADKSGKHIDTKTSEADIVQEIVDQILPQINPTALDVAEYPVGLPSGFQDITALLSSGTKDVIKIGIYGMGGVGKTTLARAVFEVQLSLGSFKGSCFLSDVRQTLGTSKGLESLQQQLINDVLKSKDKFVVTSVAQGTELIKARICSTKILVVIDDLDDHKEFKSLVGPFASGSVIIITTRDEGTLDKVEVETKYKVNEMGDAESKKLFYHYAFGNTKPNNTLMILSKDILLLAGGLPLALTVFGSHLYKESEDSWKSYIEDLQQNPDNDIQKKLMISLNALKSKDLKKMFLDIACFFIGRKKEDVVEILDTYYSYADDKIDKLMKKSLLTINNDNEFQMHDLLQDVGKEIARNNSPDEPGKYSRLWLPTDVCYVLEEHKGTEAIEGIILHRFEPKDPFKEVSGLVKEVSFSMKTFRRMSKLRFLSFYDINFTDYINLTGKFERTLEDLRWFCWTGCPLKCLPSDFRPQKIVILELPRSKMTKMWEVNKVPNAFKKLKTLNMSFSRDLTSTPDFRRLPCLRKLNFDGCTSLKEVHNSIGSLVSLVSLNLNGCKNLRSLPDTIFNLRALEVLCIGSCTMLEALPIQLGNIESLKELDAEGLAVSKLPDSIGDLSMLVKLNLNFNQKLESLPSTICNLRALEFLSISGCTKVEALPVDLGNIESLKEFRAFNLPVTKLPDSICNMRSLEILNIGGCDKLERLPDQLWKLTRLLELDVSDTALLKRLPDIESTQTSLSLTQLYLSGSKITALPSGISLLSNLEELLISGCGQLLSIAELPPNLWYIDVEDCTSLERLNLSDSKHLKILRLLYCTSLTEISGLGELTSLEQIFLQGCHSSLLARTLTMALFQIYSDFEHEIGVCLESENFPDWIIQSSVWDWCFESSVESIVNLQPNLSHNYLGMILCFEPWDEEDIWEAWDGWNYGVRFSVMTSASNILTDKKFNGSSSMLIVPRSIFTVTDADHTITFKSSGACRHWIRLLYKNEDDSTSSVNVEDERNNPWASDLEVEEEGGHPSKRLKLDLSLGRAVNEDESTSVNVEDERNNPFNVEDERNNPLGSDLEVEEEGGHPSRRLKLLQLFV